MKVLVISHNVFCKTSNMGKTLKSYFDLIDPSNIAQLYVHSEIPTDDCCETYYRVTDKEMIGSIFTRRSGAVFGVSDIKKDAFTARVDTGTTAKLYQKARSRTPMIYLARNLWWRLGAWKTKRLLRWVDEFDPDVIFLASGDYAFIYRIALELAKYKNIPLAVSCMDDYYFYNKNENRFLGKAVHKAFMKQVRKTMDYASCIFPICEKMKMDYQELFHKPCYTLNTPSTITEPISLPKSNEISYIGNLGYKRHEQIIALGRVLKNLSCEGKPYYIDVYSAESRPEKLKNLTEENGIRFHGAISAEEVLKVMGRSMAVIHTESFNKSTRRSVAYSVSTKIADSLASGTCILAYGPPEIASIKYLKDNNAAYCITDEKEIENGLLEFISNHSLRKQIVKNAIALAKENHDSRKNGALIMDKLRSICVDKQEQK